MSASVVDKERRLGPYVLKRPLGEGGNGQVFLAWKDNASNEPLPCVVKFPLQRHAKDEESRRRFFQEATLAMRLGGHPNIVHVIDVGIHQQMPFIVMEFIDGADLHLLLHQMMRHRRRLSAPSIFNILASAAAALHHAHFGATIDGKAVGIVHRDIKPANMLITRDGFTKLADFGIGATVEDGTTGNHWRGTARYMSPEHLRCEVRPEMDIYSLGVVAWEMIEGRRYRDDCRGTQHYPPILEGRVPPMANRGSVGQLASIIDACLDANPRQRPTAAELLKALSRCPGFSRDPSVVQHELASVIGTRRTSGATQQEFAATPELVATFAVLEQPELCPPAPIPSGPATLVCEPDEDEPTQVQPAERTRRWERPSPPRPFPPEGTRVLEPDAPRFFRRPRNRVSVTVVLEPEVESEPLGRHAQGGGDRPPTTSTVRPPWADEPREHEPVAVPTSKGTERTSPSRTARDTKTAPSTRSRPQSRAGWRRWRWRPGAGVVAVSVAAIGSIALGFFGGLGGGEPRRAEFPPTAAVEVKGSQLGATSTPVDRPTPVPTPDRALLVPAVGPDDAILPSSPESLPATAEPAPSALTPSASADPVVDPSPASPTAPSAEAAAAPITPSRAAEPAEPTSASKRPPPPPRAAPPPPVPVTLTLFLVDAAEIQIGRKRVHVRRKTTIEVPAGRHRIRWRLGDDEAWQDMGRVRFVDGHAYLVRLRSSGTPDLLDLERKVK